MKSLRTSAVRRTAIAVTTFILCGAFAIAQEATSIAANPDRDTMTAVRSLQEQVECPVPRRDAGVAPRPSDHAHDV